MPAAAILFQNIQKNYGDRRILKGIDLEIPSGAFFVLLGENGAGKSTLLRIMTSLLEPDQGRVTIQGHDLARAPEAAKRNLAYLPDEAPVYDLLTPLEYLEFLAALWDVPARKAEVVAKTWLEHFGLWERRFDFAEGFSRGMRQKLALTGAFVRDARIIALDEPLTGLDAPSSFKAQSALEAFVREGGTVILTTHLLEVAERLGTLFAVLHDGEIRAQGSLEDLRVQSGVHGDLEAIFSALMSEAA
jgi:ABC-2 type transport system ATP-binding protein